MFLKIAASGIGGATIVGTGLGIYLSNNKKKEDKNSNQELGDNLVETPTETKAQRIWNNIIASAEYKNAKTTGKILNHISYKEDEIPDDDADYFLVKMSVKLEKNTFNNIKEITVGRDNAELLTFKSSDNNSNFPFYCFETTVENAEDLNFNDLKQCKEITSSEEDQFFVVNDLQNKITKTISSQRNSENEWSSNLRGVTFVFEKDENDERVHRSGTIMNIFYTGFSPKTNNSSNP